MSCKMSSIPFIRSYDGIRKEMAADLQYRLGCRTERTSLGRPLHDRWSLQTSINLPPRVRMATLYAVAQSLNGRVANTCNLSEDWVGYSTRYGDSVGDFSPLSKLTTSEVVEVGKLCGLPDSLVCKVPSDGLCGKTDEDNLGFSYSVLNEYIRTGVCENLDVKETIDSKHRKNLFKLEQMPTFDPDIDIAI